jgi:SAM-dependent methyltransferase
MKIKDIKAYLPNWFKKLLKMPVSRRITSKGVNFETLPSYKYYSNLMLNYQVKNLVNTNPDSFKQKIFEFLELTDYKMENFDDPTMQRDLSIKFHWGHNHDFGDFILNGRLRDRHIRIITAFKDELKAFPKSLKGKKFLDIGCWTGGTSLILCALGAEVLAIDEVNKYIESLKYLKYAFDIKKLTPKKLSLYECTLPELQDSFDFILFAGVLYHVSDLIIALRILFNCLKNGGKILVETATTISNTAILVYKGPTITTKGSKKNLSRGGWNWFFPSPLAIEKMMEDVGFVDIKTIILQGRCFAIGVRKTHVDMMRSGLSAKIR